MAKIIPEIYLAKAKNAQHDEFMLMVLANAELCQPITALLRPDLEAFREAVAAEHEMVSRPRRWETTPEIKETDEKRDKVLSALRLGLMAALQNPDAEVRAAAEIVLRMSEIDKISRRDQLDEQTGKIAAMITTLEGEYAEQTRVSTMRPYVIKLKELNNKLSRLLQKRDQLQGELGPRETRKLRDATDAAYRKLILSVNSVATTIDLGLLSFAPQSAEGYPTAESEKNGVEEEGANPFAVFIDFMNGQVDRFHREVLHRKTRKRRDETLAEEELSQIGR